MTLPDDHPPLPGCLSAALLALALAGCAVLATLARAQPADTTVLLLARTCVSERGWRTETDDCAALYAVATYHAETRGVTPAAALRLLSPRLHGTAPIGREWLRHLDPSLARPDALGAPWTRPRAGGLPSRRDAWEATLAQATAIVAGTVPSPCLTPPRAWGSDADLARRRAAGFRWVEADCGSTVNHYGRLMRRVVDPD